MSQKLAFFMQDLRGGGAERSVVRVINGIVEQGYDVDLVLISRKGPYLDELDPRVTVVELPQKRTATAIFGLAKYLGNARPHALVSTMTHANVAAILATRLMKERPRVVVVEHNQFDRNAARKSGLVKAAYRLVPMIYRLADCVAGVSIGVCDSIARAALISRSKIKVLYNPVITPDYWPKLDEPVSHPWLVDKTVPVILAVGRLTEQKNYPLLLEAFAKVRKQRSARLIVLGEGELLQSLKNKTQALGLQDDVDWAGFNANPFAFMKQASVFVMSSDWEGLPTVLIEALASGTPVVSTNCVSGPDEILQGGKYGALVPIGNADALAQALLQAIDKPSDATLRVERAKHYGLESAVAAYLKAAGV